MNGTDIGDRERKRLERRIRDLEARLDTLSSAPRPPEKKSLWQNIVGFLAATSLASAAVGGAVTIMTKDDPRCTAAHEAIRDDSLNSALTTEQQKAYLTEQMQIAQKCDSQD